MRRVCCDLGIVLCDPQRLPLPALLHAAAKPNADDYLPEAALGELVSLAEPLCQPMQHHWLVPDVNRRTLTVDLDYVSSASIGDTLYLQDELTDDLLDAIDLHAPGHLERRAGVVADRLQPAALIAS